MRPCVLVNRACSDSRGCMERASMNAVAGVGSRLYASLRWGNASGSPCRSAERPCSSSESVILASASSRAARDCSSARRVCIAERYRSAPTALHAAITATTRRIHRRRRARRWLAATNEHSSSVSALEGTERSTSASTSRPHSRPGARARSCHCCAEARSCSRGSARNAARSSAANASASAWRASGDLARARRRAASTPGGKPSPSGGGSVRRWSS